MAPKAVLALALLAGAAGHPDGLEESGRRLTSSSFLGHIWGSWGGMKCTSYLSDGPADADVEIRLAGLPASTAGQAVHLQWWSPRKSPTEYKPLESAVNCSVYSSMRSAYPRYWHDAFNGGNVRVSESGEALIRVRAPSTYFMWCSVALPHIHLRLCHGQSYIWKIAHTIMLAGEEVWISSGRKKEGELPIRILSAHPYAARNASASSGASSPKARAVIVEVARPEPGTTTLPQGTTLQNVIAPAAEVSTIPAAGTTTEPSTTTMEPTTTTLEPTTTTLEPTTTLAPTTTALTADGTLGVQIMAARNALDLDALEFSPVYNCLLDQQFFDHFSDDCVHQCPASSDVAHGQCVRGENAEPKAQLEVSWRLGINCGTPCWHDKKNVTLHNVRLELAGHLDIPFQEIEVLTGFATSTSRRLSGTRTAYLTVKVDSNRIAAAEGNVLLSSFPQDAASMTNLLGLDVHTVTVGNAPPQQADPTSMDQNNDPYVPAYTAIEDVPRTGVPAPNSVLGFLPTEAIIGIAAGVVALGAAFAVAICYRRRRQRQAQAEAKQADKVWANKVEDKIAEIEAETGSPPANKHKL